MESWWNRWVSKTRAYFGAAGPSISADGTLALGVNQPLTAPVHDSRRDAAPRTSVFARIKERLTGGRASTRVQIQEAVTRLTQMCAALEQHLAHQQARADEILGVVRKLSIDLAGLPSATMEHKRQVEHLHETVTAHRNETAQLGTLLADVPAALRATGEALEAQGTRLASQKDALDQLVQQSGAVEQTHVDIRDCVSHIERTQGLSAGLIESFVQERRRLEQDFREALAKTSRRLTAMVGAAIGLALASAAFGVIQLFLRWSGG